MVFYKDGVEFSRFSYELLQDLTIKYPPGFSFPGPELTPDQLRVEVYEALHYELRDPDPELEGELRIIVDQLMTDYEKSQHPNPG